MSGQHRVTALFLAAAGAASPVVAHAAKPERPALVTNRYVTYRVTMETDVRIPDDKSPLYLRVWHATPTPRPWSMAPGGPGCLKLSHSPAVGRFEYLEDEDSWHYWWQFDGPLEPGKRLRCRTEFFVNSCDRQFHPSRARTRWEDYGDLTAQRKDVPAELVAEAVRLQASSSPARFVLRCCEWIGKRLSYDASVPHATSDAAATLRSGKGHCGHYYQILRSMCEAVGMPIRRVYGLNLYADDIAAEPLYRVRADYVNIHTWAEVEIPRYGWIEVEPSMGRDAFDIPARYVQNNPWFQNYSVWVNEEGTPKQPAWIRRAGGWRSEYGVKNLIRFETIKLGEGDPSFLPRKWTTSDGKHSVVAALAGVDGEEVRLATSDGRRVVVPRARLDAASQGIVNELGRRE